MKSPREFIVHAVNKKRYNNTKDIGGVDFIISSSEEDHRFSNREAVVVETPIGYNGPIEKGDILLVHHNVFKYYNDMYGRQKSGKSFLKDDLFFIDNEQFFMYKKKDKWFCHDRYCFIKPIAAEKKGSLEKNCAYEPLVGVMKYANIYLKSKGVKEGDKVCFTPHSEYEFTVDEELLYRVYDHQVTVVL